MLVQKCITSPVVIASVPIC